MASCGTDRLGDGERGWLDSDGEAERREGEVTVVAVGFHVPVPGPMPRPKPTPVFGSIVVFVLRRLRRSFRTSASYSAFFARRKEASSVTRSTVGASTWRWLGLLRPVPAVMVEFDRERVRCE